MTTWTQRRRYAGLRASTLCRAFEPVVVARGALYYYHHNDTSDITWLRRIQEHFRACIWLNPLSAGQWNRTTIHLVRQVFPMYEFTLDGLERGIKQLVRKVA